MHLLCMCSMLVSSELSHLRKRTVLKLYSCIFPGNCHISESAVKLQKIRSCALSLVFFFWLINRPPEHWNGLLVVQLCRCKLAALPAMWDPHILCDSESAERLQKLGGSALSLDVFFNLLIGQQAPGTLKWPSGCAPSHLIVWCILLLVRMIAQEAPETLKWSSVCAPLLVHISSPPSDARSSYSVWFREWGKVAEALQRRTFSWSFL